MEESTAHIIHVALELFLLIGGFITAAALALREGCRPPDRGALTAALTRRSWSLKQIAAPLAALFSLFSAALFLGLFFYEEQLPLVQLVATYVVYGIPMIVVALILRGRGATWSSGLGMGRRELRGLAAAPIFYLAAIPFIMLAAHGWSVLINLLTGSEAELQDVAKLVSSGNLSALEIAYMATAIFFAPIYEEVLFRGVLFPWFAERAGLAGGTAATALVFAVMHQNAAAFVPLAMLSATLSLAYWRTGSLWTSIGIHMIFNAVSILSLNLAA